MSLEYALERFPLKRQLRDGTPCVIRPLAKADHTRLQKFFTAVPELERLFMKKPVTNRALLRKWCCQPDFEVNLPLVMLKGSQIIGEVTLHQRTGGWKRHVGMVTMLTHPDYRGRDVARILVEEIVSVAQHLGLKKLECELNGERTVAIRALESLGFARLFQLRDYVLDMESKSHDYVMMGMNLRVDEEYAGVG